LPSAGRALGKVTGNVWWSDGVNILPSAPIKSTRQNPFADKYVAEWTLPDATLGKAKGSLSSAKGSLPSVKTFGEVLVSSSETWEKVDPSQRPSGSVVSPGSNQFGKKGHFFPPIIIVIVEIFSSNYKTG
jgi:hypothetical protein